MVDINLYGGAAEPEDIKLRYAGQVEGMLKELFDVLYGFDSVAIDKPVLVTDSAIATDSVARDWMPTVLDALFSSDLPYVHRQVLVTDVLHAIEQIPSTPEKTIFVTDFLTALESFHDVWKGKWDEPIQKLYQSLREMKVKLVTEKEKELKTKEP